METNYSREIGGHDNNQPSNVLFGNDDEMMFSKRRNPELVKADKLMKQYLPNEITGIIDQILSTGRIDMSMLELEQILWTYLKYQDIIMGNPDKAMVARHISRLNRSFLTGQALSWKTDSYNPRITTIEELRKNLIEIIYSRSIKNGANPNENEKQYNSLNMTINKHEITQREQPIVKEKGFLRKLFGR